MKVRGKDGTWTGISGSFNMHGLGEIIVYFDDEPDGTHNGADSVFISDCEVLVNGAWMGLHEAFASNAVITDNYNSSFFEPATEEDRKRGYTL